MKGAYYFITFHALGNRFSDEEIGLIRSQIISGQNKYYSLIAVQVMPDHVHLILKLIDSVSLGKTMQWIKGSTARLVNKSRDERGSLWMIDYHDRIIRHQQEFDEKLKYMYENPVRAGIVENPENYWGWYLQQ